MFRKTWEELHYHCENYDRAKMLKALRVRVKIEDGQPVRLSLVDDGQGVSLGDVQTMIESVRAMTGVGVELGAWNATGQDNEVAAPLTAIR